MKESIGKSTPESVADRNHDGVADEAEEGFSETSQRQPVSGDAETMARPAKPEAEGGEDDDGMESARKASTVTAPGSSN